LYRVFAVRLPSTCRYGNCLHRRRPEPSEAHKRFALARMLGEVEALTEEEAEEMTEIEKSIG